MKSGEMDLKDTKKKHAYDWKKCCAIIGSFVMIIPSGIYSMWGNISVYALSYVYKYHGLSRIIRTPWEISAYLLSMYVGYNLTGYMLMCCNKQLLLFLIVLLSNGSYITVYFALMYDIIPLAIILVFLVGFSIGIVESVVFKYIADWSGTRKGYLISIACSGMNFGPFIVNPIITAYVNPENQSPAASEGGFAFITQEKVMKKVPSLFILIGFMFLGIQLIGLVFMNLQRKSEESTDKTEKNYGSISTEMMDDINAQGSNSSGETTGDANSANGTHGDDDAASEIDGFTPSQTLRSSIFYILWLCNASRDFSSILLNSYYKAYAQNWIEDDYLLTAVGSVLGIAGGFMRLTWGFALDRYSLKNCLVFVFGSTAISLLLMYFSAMYNKWLYLIVTVFYGSVHSCLFPTVVSSTLVLFGPSHFNKNLGLVNTASMVADILAPPVFESFLRHFGWFWIFGLVASLFTLTLIIIVFAFPTFKESKSLKK